MHDSRIVTAEEAIKFAESKQLTCMETSALNSSNIDLAFTTILKGFPLPLRVLTHSSEILHRSSKKNLEIDKAEDVTLKSSNKILLSQFKGNSPEQPTRRSCCFTS